MADDLKEAAPTEQKDSTLDLDPELWDWARAAGVSREELLRALEASRPR
jgi:hypothetical protein